MPRLEQLASNDPREGTITDAQSEFWKEIIEKAETPDLGQQRRRNFEQLLSFVNQYKAGWFISCWHRNPSENFAFWRIYGRQESICSTCGQSTLASGESVAITTTFAGLEALLPAHIEVGVVRYLDYQRDGVSLYNMFDHVMHKRDFYRYENEVRAVTSMESTRIPGPARDHILSNQVEGSYAPPIDVKALVGEVVVHPEATRSFQEEVTTICKENDLPSPRLSGLAVR
jgi:hypothetical protein